MMISFDYCNSGHDGKERERESKLNELNESKRQNDKENEHDDTKKTAR